MAARKKKSPASRIGARESAARRCPDCNATPLRQVGDPRLDERGWEYRRRACDCGWSGIELRAIVDVAFAKILNEVIDQQKAEAQEKAAKDLEEAIG